MIKLDVGMTIECLEAAITSLCSGDSISAAEYTEAALRQICSHMNGHPIEVLIATAEMRPEFIEKEVGVC